MKAYSLVLASILMVLVQCAGALAEPIALTVPDFSFETVPAQTNNNQYLNPPVSWTYGGLSPSTTLTRGVATLTAGLITNTANTHGASHLYLYQNTATVVNGDLGYVTSTAPVVAEIAPNMNYTLTVALGNRAALEVPSGLNIVHFQPYEYRLQFLANDVVVATEVISDPRSITPNGMVDFSLSMSTPASGGIVGQALKIRISHTAGTYDGDIRISMAGSVDNVRLFAEAVPEPSALTGLLLGGLALCGLRKRKAAQLA